MSESQFSCIIFLGLLGAAVSEFRGLPPARKGILNFKFQNLKGGYLFFGCETLKGYRASSSLP